MSGYMDSFTYWANCAIIGGKFPFCVRKFQTNCLSSKVYFMGYFWLLITYPMSDYMVPKLLWVIQNRVRIIWRIERMTIFGQHKRFKISFGPHISTLTRVSLLNVTWDFINMLRKVLLKLILFPSFSTIAAFFRFIYWNINDNLQAKGCVKK